MRIRRVWHATFGPRTWREMAYVVVSLPLAAVGFAYVVVSVALSVPLSLTLLGLPLLAGAVTLSAHLADVHRFLARTLLDLRLTPPARRPRPSGMGVLARIGWALSETLSWRAMAYLFLKLPLAVVAAYATAISWGQGAFLLAFPIALALFGTDSSLTDGFSGLHLGTWVAATTFPILGAILLCLAPWITRGLLFLDKLLMRVLLGQSKADARVRELEETRARVIEDAAATLRRLERDLHDGTQARLVALAMSLGLVRKRLADPDGSAMGRTRAIVDDALDNAKEAIVELRGIVRGIHPPALDKGLEPALQTLAARCAVPTNLTIEVEERPSPAIETIAYFCVAELLANVARHSRASLVVVEVSRTGDRLLATVIDDGAGGARFDGGSGLSGLRDRVRAVDGTLLLESPAGGPTVVHIELPCHA